MTLASSSIGRYYKRRFVTSLVLNLQLLPHILCLPFIEEQRLLYCQHIITHNSDHMAIISLFDQLSLHSFDNLHTQYPSQSSTALESLRSNFLENLQSPLRDTRCT
ncbi:Uncharacterized protein HZ326_5929 [Fusarium oxysporum f. sp. albedinis]|nr:Uncharacterized protein HZ326_5929 [Fusarium oxysporum f. sp. albedinis]